MSFKVNEVEGKVVASKRHINLKDISVADLHFVDVNPDTGEKTDITESIIAQIPQDTINFKITVELPTDEDVE